jgi:hypothetical protein
MMTASGAAAGSGRRACLLACLRGDLGGDLANGACGGTGSRMVLLSGWPARYRLSKCRKARGAVLAGWRKGIGTAAVVGRMFC